jgi:hypothetical protein
MPKKEAFHVIKIKKELCKKCGKLIADSLMAARLGILSRSSYCSLSDHCAECANEIMIAYTRRDFRFLIGAKTVKIEVNQYNLTEITIAKGTRKWCLKTDGSFGLKVSEIKKKKEKP